MDLLAMALACDLTRVASLQWRSSMTAFTWVNVNAEHHVLSHQTGSAGPDASPDQDRAPGTPSSSPTCWAC